MFSALWMLGASGCFTLMALLIKWQTPNFGVGDLLFLRLAFSALWVLLMQPLIRFDLRTTALGLHARRAAFGGLAMAAWYHTLGTLPMGISVTLNYMSPLFLGLLLYLDKCQAHRPSSAQHALLGLGFVGVLIMMNPLDASWDLSKSVAYATGVIGALCGALAFKDVKALKTAGQTEWQMVFYFSLLGALLALPFARMLREPFVWDAGAFSALALAGLLGAGGQFGVSKAFGHGDPMVPASMQYMSVVCALALGWAVFGEQIGAHGLAGMAVVTLAAIGAVAVGSRRRSG